MKINRSIRFALALVAGLALLTWIASGLVQRTTRDWFERDVRLRAEAVVNGARQALLSHWRKDESRDLRNLLVEITRDERIMAAAACGADLSAPAPPSNFPREFSCRTIADHVRTAPDSPGSAWSAWHSVSSLPGGGIYVSAIPLLENERALGFVVLVHDLSFMDRRQAETRYYLLFIFGILALIAAA